MSDALGGREIPVYLNTAEAAALIRMSRDYVARQCDAGNLYGKKVGREWRIHRDELARFMSTNSPAPATRPLRRRAG